MLITSCYILVWVLCLELKTSMSLGEKWVSLTYLWSICLSFSFNWFVFTWRSAVSFLKILALWLFSSEECLGELTAFAFAGISKYIYIFIFFFPCKYLLNFSPNVSELPPCRLSSCKGWWGWGHEGPDPLRLFLLWGRSLFWVKKELLKTVRLSFNLFYRLPVSHLFLWWWRAVFPCLWRMVELP